MSRPLPRGHCGRTLKLWSGKNLETASLLSEFPGRDLRWIARLPLRDLNMLIGRAPVVAWLP